MSISSIVSAICGYAAVEEPAVKKKVAQCFLPRGNHLISAINMRSLGRSQLVVQEAAEARLKENIVVGDYIDTIFGVHHSRFSFCVDGDRILTCGTDGKMNCLDFRTGKKIWEHTDEDVMWGQNIFVSHSSLGAVVCAGWKTNRVAVIRILLLTTGQKLTDIEDPRIPDPIGAFENKSVFTLCRDRIFVQGSTAFLEWNLEGVFQRALSLPFQLQADYCQNIGHDQDEKHLIVHRGDVVFIHNLDTTGSITFDRRTYFQIKTAFIEIGPNYFMRGIVRDHAEEPFFVKKNDDRKSLRLRVENPLVYENYDRETDTMSWMDKAPITAPMQNWNGLMYFGDDKGVVSVVDTQAKKQDRLGRHSNTVQYTSREGSIMATGSRYEVNVWDLETGFQLRNFSFSDDHWVSGVLLRDGKLMIGVGDHLIVSNFS